MLHQIPRYFKDILFINQSVLKFEFANFQKMEVHFLNYFKSLSVTTLLLVNSICMYIW